MRKLLVGLCLAVVPLGAAEARDRHAPPSEGATAAQETAPGRAPVLLEVRRSRHGAPRVRVRTAGAEVPGSDAPEAFWIGFYNSVSDALYPDRSARRGRERRRGPREVGDPLLRLGLLCAKQAEELAGWDAAGLAQRVDADADQTRQLQDVRTTAQAASQSLKRECERVDAEAPLWRLDLALRRVQAMQQAADALQPALSAFVAGLRSEQRERHAALTTPAKPARDPADQQRAAMFCSLLVPPTRVSATLERLVRATRPGPDQAQRVNEIIEATARSQRLLHESCVLQRAGDALAQLEIMRKRLQLSVEAIESVQAAVTRFHESLGVRQRRSFARLGYGGEARAQAFR